jgi:hypothetical protein
MTVAEAVNVQSGVELTPTQQTCTANTDRIKAYTGSDFTTWKANLTSKYSDPTFTADNSSLYWPAYAGNEMRSTYDSIGVSWKRPSEIEASPNLYGADGIRPGAIIQGMLGDCWFLAACGALAEWPDRVKKVFTNLDYAKSGVFEVNLWHKGKTQKVVVDDRLPYKEGSTWFDGTYTWTQSGYVVDS